MCCALRVVAGGCLPEPFPGASPSGSPASAPGVSSPPARQLLLGATRGRDTGTTDGARPQSDGGGAPRSALPLLVPRCGGADDHDPSVTTDHLALVADGLDAGLDLQRWSFDVSPVRGGRPVFLLDRFLAARHRAAGGRP